MCSRIVSHFVWMWFIEKRKLDISSFIISQGYNQALLIPVTMGWVYFKIGQHVWFVLNSYIFYIILISHLFASMYMHSMKQCINCIQNLNSFTWYNTCSSGPRRAHLKILLCTQRTWNTARGIVNFLRPKKWFCFGSTCFDKSDAVKLLFFLLFLIFHAKINDFSHF